MSLEFTSKQHPEQQVTISPEMILPYRDQVKELSKSLEVPEDRVLPYCFRFNGWVGKVDIWSSKNNAYGFCGTILDWLEAWEKLTVLGETRALVLELYREAFRDCRREDFTQRATNFMESLGFTLRE